jgi:uncharacterized membrane protein
MEASTSFSGKTDPVVRHIAISDIVEVLIEGLRDFQTAPAYGVTLGAICGAVGIGIIYFIEAAGMGYFAYPLAAGFALVSPFIAAGLYEVSRRLEKGQPLSAGEIWSTVWGRSEVRWMGFVTLFILIVWMYQVRFLMALFLGMSGSASTLPEFINLVLTTNEGLIFLALGNIFGAILSLILFSLTVVSFPLVLDRDVDFVTAMVTSVRAVAANPGPMLSWAALIVALLVASALTFFLGLLVTLPVLGHGTWHLYRRVVEPAKPDDEVPA